MAQNIHPTMKPVTYKFSKGRTLVIQSNYKNSEFLLENDVFLHSAWREDSKVINSGSAKISKFNASFGGASPLGSFSPLDLEMKADTTVEVASKPKAKKKEVVESETVA
jgi:ribosomal protein L31